MSMRLAIDLRSLLEPFESGVSVYTRAMVTEFLRMRDLDVELFYQARKRCGSLHKEFPGVRHIEMSTFWHRLKSLLCFRALPDDYFEKRPDLIWLPDRREFFKTDIPVVMTVHDAVPERFSWTLSWKGRILHRIFPLRRLLKLCKAVLVPSFTVGSDLPRGVRKEVTYEGASFVERAEAVKVKKPYFLAISPADPRKRLDWVFEMARLFPKKNFVVAGMKKGDKRFSRLRLKKLKNVSLLGRVSEGEKLWLLKNAEAFLAVSAYEGFDLPVLEAAKAKCPIIMSDIAVHHELYKDACFVSDECELRAAIYGGNARVPKLRGDYTWAGAAKRALLLFRRVVADKN